MTVLATVDGSDSRHIPAGTSGDPRQNVWTCQQPEGEEILGSVELGRPSTDL